MASKNTKNTADGDAIIIKELSKHLNYEVRLREDLIKLSKDGIIAVETLLEKALSKVGKLNRSNENGEDFDDGTDAKKGVVTLNDKVTGSRAVTIGNVANKKGMLRVLVADPLVNQIYYFKIPRHECVGKLSIKIFFSKLGGHPEHLPKTLQRIISLFENDEKPEYDNIDFSTRAWIKYRVHSFEELAAPVLSNNVS